MVRSPTDPSRPLRDPAIIDLAPVEPDPQDFNADQSAIFLKLVGQLSSEVEDLTAENARLTGQKTFDNVRAAMAEPYANKVFWFLVWYCVFVGIIILMNGFQTGGFHISDVVLGVIAGSTAVAAIGLVGFVVSGLFGAKSPRSETS
jgi:hypothetical protein